jgi:hypothetical protein
MNDRIIYRDLTANRRRWLEQLDLWPRKRRAGVVAADCERLGWTHRLPTGHDALTPLGRTVLRWGRADVSENPAVPVVNPGAAR